MAITYPASAKHEATSTPVTAAPLSISFRLFNAATANGGSYVKIYDSTAASNVYFWIYNDDGRVVRASAKDFDATGTAVHGTTISNSTWHQAGGLFESSTSRYAVLNGVLSSQNTTSVSGTTSVNRILIGDEGTFGQQVSIAEVGIWNVALTQAEWTSLAAGYAPPLIRRSSLVFYAPLVRDVIDLYGRSLSASGSPTVLEHPRVILPRKKQAYCVPAAAPSFLSAWARGSNILISPGSL